MGTTETTPNTAAATAEGTPAAKKRSDFNERQLGKLRKVSATCATAKNTLYAPGLALREITGAFVTQLDDDVETCRLVAAQTKLANDNLVLATEAEAAARLALLLALADIQKAARQKFRKGSTERNAFRASTLLNRESLARLEEITIAISEALTTTSLPGITPQKVTALPLLLKAYTDANDAQTIAQTAATTLRTQRDELFESIMLRHNQLLNAADGAFPHTTPSNAPIRRAFGLPPTRAYNG